MTDNKTTAADLYESMEYGPAPESDKAAMEWVDGGKRKFGPYVGGKFRPVGNRKTIEVTAPADGRALGATAQSTKKDVDDAVAAAKEAQKDWAKLSGFERAKYLYALGRAIYDQSRDFEVLEALDNGKAFRDTKNADMPLARAHFDHHADFAMLMDNDADFDNYEPYGVVGQIIPWNFPMLMLAWKIAPALAAGNAVVLKPAEDTPLTALKFAEVCEEIGLPKGLVNIVTGDGVVGNYITNHEGVDKVAFTGSTDVGRIIRKATADSEKGLSLELGGKSPFIVFDDADLDSAVEGVVNAIWFNQGEVCCGGSRLLIQESIHDKFVEKLKRRMETLRVGGPLDKTIDMGSVVSKAQHDQVQGFITRAREDGAEIYQACKTDGNFIPPTLITNVSSNDEVMQDEIFGPVLSAMSFRTPAEAIELANNTRYGLAASVWSEDQAKANALAAAIRAGVIWINTTNQFDGKAEFGGYAESGFGRDGGKGGLLGYLKPKTEQAIGLADVSKPKTEYKSVAKRDIDLTRKFFVGGKEARPDGGSTRNVINDKGALIGRVGIGNRKDIRNAVSAARSAESGWSSKTGYQRSQVLKFAAERLSKRTDEFARTLSESTGCSAAEARAEVDASIKALFNFASWSNMHEGVVHEASNDKTAILALNEHIGVIGITAPNEKPLLSYVTMVAAALAGGNTVVTVPSEKAPIPAMDLIELFRAADIPAGVINTVTGSPDELAGVMAEHNDVDAIWYHGSSEGSAIVQTKTAESNLKQSWVNNGHAYDWDALATKGSKHMMRRATQTKNIWSPSRTGIGLGGGGSY